MYKSLRIKIVGYRFIVDAVYPIEQVLNNICFSKTFYNNWEFSLFAIFSVMRQLPEVCSFLYLCDELC
jgi:hypothetical protein